MAFESNILFAFGAMVCWGLGDFFIQQSTRKIGNIEALAIIGVFGSIGLLPFVLPEFHLLFSMQNFLVLLLLGIITFIAAIFDFEALKQGKISVVDMILEIELPVTIVLGFIFFGEAISTLQLSVISLVFLGIVLVSAETLSPRQYLKKIEKGVFLAVIAAVGMGFVNFLTAASSRQVSPLMAIWVPWLVYSIMCIFLIWRKEGLPKLIENFTQFKNVVIPMAVFDTLAWVFFAFALVDFHLAITTAITESYPAIAMLLGVWLNKEKILPHQYFGGALAIASSFGLAFLA